MELYLIKQYFIFDGNGYQIKVERLSVGKYGEIEFLNIVGEIINQYVYM